MLCLALPSPPSPVIPGILITVALTRFLVSESSLALSRPRGHTIDLLSAGPGVWRLPMVTQPTLDSIPFVTAVALSAAAPAISEGYADQLVPPLSSGPSGPFRTSPLGTVPKANSDNFCIIQDSSFPCNSPLHSSVNSEIDTTLFQCDWGTFANCLLRVMNTPPGTQVAVFDVDSAY